MPKTVFPGACRLTSWASVPPLLACLIPSPVAALDFGVSAGASVTASRDATPVLWADWAGEGRTSGPFRWRPTATLGYIAARDVRADLDRHVLVAGAGFRVVDWWKRAFLGVGFGYASRTTAALSSHGQFVTSLGWDGRRHTVILRHVSNADLFGGKNLGETMLLVGIKF